MGLHITHGCWTGPYTRFARFRSWLASWAGLPPLDLMAGHYEGHLIPTYAKVQPNFLIHTLERIEKDLPISWEPFSSDPIVTLLHHSDCDGEISKEECVALAGRLREVLATAGESRTKGEAEDFRPKLVQFIEGLERAIAAGEGVEFC